jgi:tRNA threonylcarbamoyladenosine biosynthesis protein TsaE
VSCLHLSQPTSEGLPRDLAETAPGAAAMHLRSDSPETTQRIGAALARLLKAGDWVALTGPLGAGKTCLTQGIARGLGIRQVVTSPSFVLAKHYLGSPGLLHVDAYRLASAEEFIDLGLEYDCERSVTVVEWAENVSPALPPERLEVWLTYGEGNRRALDFHPRGSGYEAAVARLAETCSGEGVGGGRR